VRPLAVGIVLASTVLYVRALALTAFFDGAMAVRLVPRLCSLLVVGLLIGALAYRGLKDEGPSGVKLGNPTEIGKALLLGLLFSLVLIGARIAQVRFGAGGIWLTGLVGGLVDVDSVIVAVAQLRQQGLVPVADGAGAVLLATVANLVLKGALVVFLGGMRLARFVWPGFLALALLTAVWLAVDLF
jgi:uncharacterized membrane protein (DUF4010 family)